MSSASLRSIISIKDRLVSFNIIAIILSCTPMAHPGFSILRNLVFIFISVFAIVLLSSGIDPSFAILSAEKDGDANGTLYFIDTKNNDPLSTILTSRDVLNYTDEGDELFDEGKYDQAIKYYDKALASDPNDYEALYNKGGALANLEKYEEAITYFDKALAVEPENVNTLNWKGYSLYNLEKYDDAITYFDKVLEIDPHNEYAKNLRTFSSTHAPHSIDSYFMTSTGDVVDEASSNNTNNKLHTFRDSKTKVSFRYPSDWEIASDEYVKSNYGSTKGVIALLLPKSLDGATMSIFYEDLPFSMSANEYAKASKKALLENKDTSVSDNIAFSIGTLDGYKYNVTLSDVTLSTENFVQTHIVFVKNSKGYLLAYNPGATDVAQDLQDIKSMIESFGINNSNKEKTENDVSIQSSDGKEFAIAKDKARDIMTYIFSSIFPQTGEKYINTNYGVDIAFPKNWTGFEMKVIFPMAVVSPEGFNITDIFSSVIDTSVDNIAEKIISNGISDLPEQKKQELTESVSNKLMEYTENRTSTMGVFIYDKEFTRLMRSLDTNNVVPVDSLTSSYELFGTSDPTVSCDRKTLEYITLKNNISAERSTEECTHTTNNKDQKNLNYFILTPNAIVHIQYTSDTKNENDKFLPEFEQALKTLSVKETLPINNQTIQRFLSD